MIDRKRDMSKYRNIYVYAMWDNLPGYKHARKMQMADLVLEIYADVLLVHKDRYFDVGEKERITKEAHPELFL